MYCLKFICICSKYNNIVFSFMYMHYLVIPVDLLKYKPSTNNKLVSFTLFRKTANWHAHPFPPD